VKSRSGGRGGGTKVEGGRSRSKSILTGVALGVVVLGAFAAGAAVAEVLVAAAVTIAAAEYFSTIRRGGVQPATLVGLVAVVLIVAGGYLRGFPGVVDGLVVGVIVTMLWYLSGIIQSTPFEGMSRTIFGITWIGLLGGFASLILRPADFSGHGVRLLLATLIVTSASDVFAYFGGQVFGKHKMAPSISPSKTYEGFAIGAIASLVLGFVVAGHIHPLTPLDGLILGLAAAIVTPIGDLAESMIKRSLNVKDASNLLPGHGGFLDRIDGVLFMLPTAYFLFRFLHIG
jgi:phosphatidate cytidylyltransferase